MEKMFQIRMDEEVLKRLELLAGKYGLDRSKYMRSLILSQPVDEPLVEAEEQLRVQIPLVMTTIDKVLKLRIEKQKKAEIDKILADASSKQVQLDNLSNRIRLFCKRKHENPAEVKEALIKLKDLIPLGDIESMTFITSLLKILEPEKQQVL